MAIVILNPSRYKVVLSVYKLVQSLDKRVEQLLDALCGVDMQVAVQISVHVNGQCQFCAYGGSQDYSNTAVCHKLVSEHSSVLFLFDGYSYGVTFPKMMSNKDDAEKKYV